MVPCRYKDAQDVGRVSDFIDCEGDEIRESLDGFTADVFIAAGRRMQKIRPTY